MANELQASLAKALELTDQDLTRHEKEAAEKRNTARRERREALARQRDIVAQAAEVRSLLSGMEKVFSKAGLSRLFHDVTLGRELNTETGQTVKNHVNVFLGDKKYSIRLEPVDSYEGNKIFRRWEYSIQSKNGGNSASSEDQLVETLGYWATQNVNRKTFNQLKKALG